MTRRRQALGRTAPEATPDPEPATPEPATPELEPVTPEPVTPTPDAPADAADAPADAGTAAPEPPARQPLGSLGSVAREVAVGWRDLLWRSQPRSWPLTALPFLVAAYDGDRAVTPVLVLGGLYFLGPYNLLLHGFDAGGGTEDPEAASIARTRLTRLAIALTNLPFLVILVLLGGPGAGLALLLAVAAGLAYSLPPLRTRERPLLDSVTRTLHLVLPAVCGSLIGGRPLADLPWSALAAFAIWALASDMLGTIAHMPRDGVRGATTATRVGPRLTAVVALVGYAVAAVLTVTLGRLGGLAAFGLDLFVLLPAMVLLAPRGDPISGEAAALRAWSGLVGLRVVVGLWLAALLLRHWGWFAGLGGSDIVTAASALAAGYVGWNILATGLATMRRHVRPTHEDEILPLTLVVVCRDAGERLTACLEALLDQTYADTTILVVDMGSTDDSPELAADLLGSAGRVTVAPPTPDGWAEWNWGRWTGAQAADTALILFVDVDTLLTPVATRLLVEQLDPGRWDLLSGVPRDDVPTAGERATVPGFAMLLFGFRPIWLSALTGGRPPRVAFADGPLMLVRREAYLSSGGHAARPESPRPDIDLARTFAHAGRRVGTVQVADLTASRRYPGADAVVRGWRRTFVPSIGGSLGVTVLAIAVEVLAFVVPLLLPPLAFLSGAEPRTLLAACIPLFLLGFARFALVLTQRHPLTTVLWHPVTVGVALIGQLAGVVDHVTGRPRPRRYEDQPLATATAQNDHA